MNECSCVLLIVSLTNQPTDQQPSIKQSLRSYTNSLFRGPWRLIIRYTAYLWHNQMYTLCLWHSLHVIPIHFLQMWLGSWNRSLLGSFGHVNCSGQWTVLELERHSRSCEMWNKVVWQNKGSSERMWIN